jgi:hypothetical protein
MHPVHDEFVGRVNKARAPLHVLCDLDCSYLQATGNADCQRLS